jgi:hypothetical protein
MRRVATAGGLDAAGSPTAGNRFQLPGPEVVFAAASLGLVARSTNLAADPPWPVPEADPLVFPPAPSRSTLNRCDASAVAERRARPGRREAAKT